MATTRSRDVALTVVGFAAWLLYILGCASFSPDDAKVLFPSNDPTTGGPVLAMYDRAARTTRTLLALPPAVRDSGAYLVRSVWTPDGEHIVALWGDNDNEIRVTVLSLSAKEPTRMLVVKELKGDMPSAILVPPPIVGSQLFMGEEGQIRRVDLRTGAEQIEKIEGEPLLVSVKDRIYYGRELPEAGAKKTRVEVGLVDARTLALTPLFETTEAEGDPPLFAVSRDGSRVALAGEKDNVPQLVIFENNQLRSTIPIGSKADEIQAGYFQWSRDGATLYCAYRKALAEKQYQFGVLEIPIDGGAVRPIPMFEVTGTAEQSEIFTWQVDVSHDGKTLAAASTYLQTPLGKKDPPRLKPQDLALYLIDLSRPDRMITKVPIPPLPAQTPASAK